MRRTRGLLVEFVATGAAHVREFVIAGHGSLEKVKAMLSAQPELLNAAYEWKDDDRETAVQAAAHVGNVAVAEYLLDRGAPLEMCTAAMLGRLDDVERLLKEDPERIRAAGAHGIPLLTHAALSGNLELVRWLVQRGARAGVSSALHNAVSNGYEDVVRWLLEHGRPDLGWKNYQGKTALAAAAERNDAAMVQLLRDHGATE